MRFWFKHDGWVRRFLTAGLIFATLGGLTSASAAELPRDSDALLKSIRHAIESNDYAHFKKLVYWKDVGEIKRRIVRAQISRGLGRPIRSMSFDPFPKDGFAGVNATGKLSANMPISNIVRIVYDEAPLPNIGKSPTAVFLIGKIDGFYRIGLVVRKPGLDDDD